MWRRDKGGRDRNPSPSLFPLKSCTTKRNKGLTTSLLGGKKNYIVAAITTPPVSFTFVTPLLSLNSCTSLSFYFHLLIHYTSAFRADIPLALYVNLLFTVYFSWLVCCVVEKELCNSWIMIIKVMLCFFLRYAKSMEGKGYENSVSGLEGIYGVSAQSLGLVLVLASV